ncbi:MAG: hypothetical protein ACYDEN_04935 [Acidimicrobiales bacterium]
MTALVRRLLRRGMRLGWRRGVLGGNRAWVVVGGVAFLANLAGRALAREEETVFREKLRPGEAFQVTNRPRS